MIPQIRSRNITVSCAVSKFGIMYRVSQTYPFNRQSFEQIIDSVQDKSVEFEFSYGIFVMDNVKFHKYAEIQDKIVCRTHFIIRL